MRFQRAAHLMPCVTVNPEHVYDDRFVQQPSSQPTWQRRIVRERLDKVDIARVIPNGFCGKCERSGAYWYAHRRYTFDTSDHRVPAREYLQIHAGAHQSFGRLEHDVFAASPENG